MISNQHKLKPSKSVELTYIRRLLNQKRVECDSLIPYLNSPDPDVVALVIKLIASSGKKSYFSEIQRHADSKYYQVRMAFANACGLFKDKRAIPYLAKYINNDIYIVKWESFLALANIPCGDSADLLAIGLGDTYPTIKMLCARCLGEIRNAEHLQALHNLATDPHKSIKSTVIEALGNIGSSSSVPLVEQALNDIDPDVRSSAILALMNFIKKDHITPLSNLVKDNSENVRVCAVLAIEKAGYQIGISHLERALLDRSPRVRAAAVRGLGTLGSYNELKLILSLRRDSNSQVKVEVANALGKLGYSESASFLVSMLHDFRKDVRKAAAAALWNLEEQTFVDPSITSEIIRVYLQDLKNLDRLERRKAVKALGIEGLKISYAPLLESLKDQDSEVRRIAVNSIAHIKTPQALKYLNIGLKDPRANVRWEAIYNIHKTININMSIVLNLLNDPEPSIRNKAISLLADISPTTYLPYFIRKLSDTDEWVRWQAVQSIIKSKSEAGIKHLRKALSDESSNVKVIAAKGLLEYNNTEVLPIIEQFLPKVHPLFQKEIRILIDKYTVSKSKKITSQQIKTVLSDSKEPQQIIECMKEVANKNFIQFFELVASKLKSKNSDIRLEAIRTLGSLQLRRAVPILYRHLNEKNETILIECIRVLSSFKSSTTKKLLLSKLKHPNEKVRTMAETGLKIFGVNKTQIYFNKFF